MNTDIKISNDSRVELIRNKARVWMVKAGDCKQLASGSVGKVISQRSLSTVIVKFDDLEDLAIVRVAELEII